MSRHVSHLYKRFPSDIFQNTYDIKETWELESNTVIDDEMWDKLCNTSHKGINSQQWRELDWKLKTRFFYTPLVISNFAKDSSTALCWRNCGKIGDHTHIFWDCPNIIAYWKNIKDEIEKIVKREVPSNCLSYLLGVIPVSDFNAEERYILHVLLLVAKKIVTVNWRSVNSPTQTEWKQRLKQVYMMERMTAILQMKMDLFRWRWHLVEDYLNG